MNELHELSIRRALPEDVGRLSRLPDGTAPAAAPTAVPAPVAAAAAGEATAVPVAATTTAPTAGTAAATAGEAAGAPPQPPLTALDKTALFVNREMSWLAFNRRVLEEAQDESVPLLERVKFLAIASSNLDEFFEIRVAGVMELVEANLQGENPDGIKPVEELERVRAAARLFNADMHRTWKELLLPALARAGIECRTVRSLSATQRQWLDAYFHKEVHPILTPLAVDPAHPFPVLLNKSLNLAVLLLDPRQARRTHRMAVVQVPRVLPRVIRLPDQDGKKIYVFTADIVQEHLGVLFPGHELLHSCSFRVTRDSNLEVDELTATDLLSSIEKELIKRRRGEPVRLEIDAAAHPDIIERFIKAFALDQDDVYFCDGPVNLARLLELYQLVDQPDLKDPPFVPRKVIGWANADEMFSDLRDGDVLLHHPYESFSTVEDFLRLSARDPRVLAIKQTIYRAGAKSSMVDALIEAAHQRKQVTAVVELKARFDEEANIQWARRMEQAGVHVVYGIVGLKTHAKTTLVVRREDDGIKRYCHIGTGNYNPTTARLYTDLGLLTARPDLGEEVAEMFNMITGYARVPAKTHLLMAPFHMRDRMLALIQRETDNARAGKPTGIRAKLNNLADPQVIMALYEASRAGVKVQLCVRGICCLRPGVPGLSDNITVKAIIDRFLEHSRIYWFENAGNPQVYISSADMMVRNLDRRVEAAAPVLDPELKKRVVDEILGMALADNVKARKVLPDGSSERIVRAPADPAVRSQQTFLELAQKQPEPVQDMTGLGPRKRKKPKRKA
ncbi:MAG: polyphosphate kinase 1 [Planctomycetes bacterium]|nr:polyphosphate kinase 1 [Planctomycetota bacterium]